MPERLWLSIPELAARLGVSPATVRFWRVQGRGPVGVNFGKQVRYHVQEVERWERKQQAAARVGAR